MWAPSFFSSFPLFFWNIGFPPSQWRERQKEFFVQPNTSMLAGQCYAKKPVHGIPNQQNKTNTIREQIFFDETLVRHM